MDLVLSVCDDLFLDTVWAHLVPLSAFSTEPEFLHALNSSFLIQVVSSSSTWSHIVSRLPHPPLSATLPPPTSPSPHSIPSISAWPRDYIPRQLLSLIVVTLIGTHLLYFIFASLSYKFVFNHDMMRHPRFLKNQVKLEIQCSLRAFPFMMLLTLPWFQAEVMGLSKMYDGVDKYGWTYFVLSVPLWVI